MADTYQSFIKKINTCNRGFFGLKRTPKDTIAILKILRDKIRGRNDLDKVQKSELLRMISKKILKLIKL